jgi:hypothetical protein
MMVVFSDLYLDFVGFVINGYLKLHVSNLPVGQPQLKTGGLAA